MSSTNRSRVRDEHIADYYITPVETIQEFLQAFNEVERVFQNGDITILDPCAGGDIKNPMSYPEALTREGVDSRNILTLDIREDSLAEIKGDFLTLDQGEFDVIISNPPFKLALEFIEHSLQQTAEWFRNHVTKTQLL